MLTRFGRELRNIRIQRHEMLYDMAKRLNISTVVLSRAENGDSKISEELLNSIEKLYALNEQESEQLKQLAYESNKQLEMKQTIKRREPKQHKKDEQDRTYKDYFTSLHTTDSSIKDEYTALGTLWSGSCPFLGTCPYIYRETKIQTCEQCVREYYSKQANC